MGSRKAKLKLAQEQEQQEQKEVEFPQRCLGKYDNEEYCEVKLPKGIFLCKDCLHRRSLASKMGQQMSFGGGDRHRRLDKNPSYP